MVPRHKIGLPRPRLAELAWCLKHSEIDSSKTSALSQAFLLDCDFLTELLGILERKIVWPDIKQEKQPRVNTEKTKSNTEIKASVSSKEP